MTDIVLHEYTIGKENGLGMIQCLVCLGKGIDICFCSKDEFDHHINMEHQKIDYTKLRRIQIVNENF